MKELPPLEFSLASPCMKHCHLLVTALCGETRTQQRRREGCVAPFGVFDSNACFTHAGLLGSHCFVIVL
jgi:hypothetical protein